MIIIIIACVFASTGIFKEKVKNMSKKLESTVLFKKEHNPVRFEPELKARKGVDNRRPPIN